MFSKILIANRGAIACRIIRTLDRMGIKSVAIYSDADRHSRHVRLAGEAVRIGPPPAVQSYLDAEAILAAAKARGAEAIHPGYGFLSENTAFAEACTAAGITFIGPTPANVRAFALKHTARELAEKAGVPLAPGSGLVATAEDAMREAKRIGFPVMLKSTAGGGGIGLQLVRTEAGLPPTFERVQRLAINNFKDAGIFVEKFVARGRHIEVQIFGDGKGKVLALGERDCSAQRRNQKVLEETPAPHLPDDVRARLCAAAVRLGQAVDYANAGTVEYLYDTDTGEFYFLEVNTRLQVEHGVTEESLGIDLVEWMVRQAAGEPLPDAAPRPNGASIQVRVYAEDPARDFRPSSGLLTHVKWPVGARVETWVESGSEVSSYYDPMIAKIITTGADREEALDKLKSTLAATELAGIETNLGYLSTLAASDAVASGSVTTSTLASLVYEPEALEIIVPGPLTSVQDYPGRVGYWAVGVPPSGPMDHLSLRLANRAVGNKEGAAALEMALSGATIKFHCATIACLVGADMSATLDGTPVVNGVPFAIRPGETLSCGTISGGGLRTYLAFQGGIEVPDYLGSKSTFALGAFGGHGGRSLRTGDVLRLGTPAADAKPESVPAELLPEFGSHWEIGVLYGPHGAPDFFTPGDIEMLFSTDWEVHYNSNRTGVRLIGPKPGWARSDGGEAGLHPSNIHDNAYAIGTIDFTGDMPVILGPDGPSLGGFVCPATIVQAELWKIGQLKPRDRLRFKRLTAAEAELLERRQDHAIATINNPGDVPFPPVAFAVIDDCIVAARDATASTPRVVYRRQGDKYLLVEYGDIVLDLELRFRVHVLMTRLAEMKLAGVIDLTPGIRSLQIHYDSRVLQLSTLLGEVQVLETAIGELDDIEVPSRMVHMPISWNDPAVQKTIDKYMQSVRPDAPWCPSNIDFIRRINGLESIDDVRRIIFEANYLVLGLGDVYLGAPVATPVDPRHRLVTTKYNPARTWTPDNVVGIGGAYMCVYGMEGPGGYQLFGRTHQVWNTYRQTAAFKDGHPWLLRFFDQIRFYPVSPEELLCMRAGMIDGTETIKIEETSFSMKAYRTFIEQHAEDIAATKRRQQAAFDAERERWALADRTASLAQPEPDAHEHDAVPDGHVAVASSVPGCIWKIAVEEGTRVEAGDIIVIVECMKMEMAIAAPHAGKVTQIRCREGNAVNLGQTLLIMSGGPG